MVYCQQTSTFLADAIEFGNTRSNGLLVGGHIGWGLGGGFAAHLNNFTVNDHIWYFGQLVIPDGFWYRNDRIVYVLVSGHLAQEYADGASCTFLSNQSEYILWSIAR